MNAGHPAPGSPVGSPLVHLKLDDGFGNYASSSGSVATISARLYNMASPATQVSGWSNDGKFGKAVSFDGTNDYAEIPDYPAFDKIPAMTVSAWINVSENWDGSNNMVPIGKEQGSGIWRFILNGAAGGHFVVATENNSWYSSGVATAFPGKPIKTWNHYVAVYDGSKVKTYVNGQLYATSTADVTGNVLDNTSPIQLGADNGGNLGPFKGTLDEFKVFNYGLTASQVKVLYNNGAVNFAPSTGAP